MPCKNKLGILKSLKLRENTKSVNNHIFEYNNENLKESVIRKPQAVLQTNLNMNLGVQGYNRIFNTINYSTPFSMNQYGSNIKQDNFKTTASDYLNKYQDLKSTKQFSCNCKKSKCLKIYCECFKNGEYCYNCNCLGCTNTPDNEIERNQILNTLKEKSKFKNEDSWKKEIDDKNLIIGCNCSKSNCSKKYCECYKLGKKCSEACRCRDCKNFQATKDEKFNNNLVSTISKSIFEQSYSSFKENLIERFDPKYKIETIRVFITNNIINIKYNNETISDITSETNNFLFEDEDLTFKSIIIK